MNVALLLLLSLVVCACTPRYADFFPYYDNGTKKPSFTLLPVYNETKNPLVANYPTELSKAIRNRLKRTGKTYSPPVSEMFKELGSTNVLELANAKDLALFSRFKGTDFVVVIETVDCNVVPYKRGSIKPIYLANIDPETAKVLQVAMRLKIIDMKGKEPKIARMELVRSNHMISEADLEKNSLEIVRSRIARDLAASIEATCCVKK